MTSSDSLALVESFQQTSDRSSDVKYQYAPLPKLIAGQEREERRERREEREWESE
jgi:hypothetical protein